MKLNMLPTLPKLRMLSKLFALNAPDGLRFRLARTRMVASTS
jgi:hypothetical protein